MRNRAPGCALNLCGFVWDWTGLHEWLCAGHCAREYKYTFSLYPRLWGEGEALRGRDERGSRDDCGFGDAKGWLEGGLGDRRESGIWHTEAATAEKPCLALLCAWGIEKSHSSPGSGKMECMRITQGMKWKGYTGNCRYDKSLPSRSLSKCFDSRIWWLVNQSRPILNIWKCLIYLWVLHGKPEFIPFSFCLSKIFFFCFQKHITLPPALVFCVWGCVGVCLCVVATARILST